MAAKHPSSLDTALSTTKTFWKNPYQTHLKTTVTTVLGQEVTFKETIAYSFSGGQENDKALVNGVPILSSRIEDDTIIYTFPENHSFAVGDEIEMEIDWPRRNRLMRLHFACELVLVIFNRIFGNKQLHEELKPEEIDHCGLEKTGAHIAEHKARIDFKYPENISKFFEQVTSEYARIIANDYPIEKGYLDESKNLRYWRIKGIATVPCGGTHVNSTAEVGLIKLKRENRGKNHERVSITLEDPEPTNQKIKCENSYG